jgi:hypothetical protein
MITTLYYLGTTGEIERMVPACQMWVQRYPWDRTRASPLGCGYGKLGDHENAHRVEKARQWKRSPLDMNTWQGRTSA